MHHECGMGRLSWVVILLFSLANIQLFCIHSKLSSHFFLRSSGEQDRNTPNSPPTKTQKSPQTVMVRGDLIATFDNLGI